jgi:uncharacterized peroxidase-related enzyme
MPLIQIPSPQHADPKSAEIYRQIEATLGRIPAPMQLLGVSPALLENQWKNLGYYWQHPSLSFPLLACIRLAVSSDHHCEYCIGMNAALLINMAGFTAEQVAAVKDSPASLPLPEKELAMLLFALKATRTPHEVNAADVQALKQLGWEERDILDATNHAARNLALDIVLNTFKVTSDE